MLPLCCSCCIADKRASRVAQGVTYYLTDTVVDAMMRRIAECPCARVAFDVYYSWYSLDPRTNMSMGQRFGEPFKSGVAAAEEGAAAERAGMEVVEVVDARRANQLYVPRCRDSAGHLLCAAFGAFAMVVAGTSTATVPMATPVPSPGDAVAALGPM